MKTWIYCSWGWSCQLRGSFCGTGSRRPARCQAGLLATPKLKPPGTPTRSWHIISHPSHQLPRLRCNCFQGIGNCMCPPKKIQMRYYRRFCESGKKVLTNIVAVFAPRGLWRKNGISQCSCNKDIDKTVHGVVFLSCQHNLSSERKPSSCQHTPSSINKASLFGDNLPPPGNLLWVNEGHLIKNSHSIRYFKLH